MSSAWFAVLPYPAHAIALKVHPGDMLTGIVTILPTGTRLQLVNRTRGWAFTRTISVGPADTTSAEWIVEPPMSCVRYMCHQATLADFDSLTFSEISATAEGRAGTLGAPAWTTTAIELGSIVPSGPEFGPTATPGAIDGQGASFTITWHARTHTDRD